MSERIRHFLAIRIGESAIQAIRDVQKQLVGLSDVYTVTKPDTFHQTLYFLGDCDDEQIAAIRERMDGLTFSSFSVSLGGLFVLPQPDIPRVLSVSIASEDRKLYVLQQSIQDRILSVAEFKESRPFLPHITFARLRREVPATAKVVKRTLRGLTEPRAEAWQVDRVVLFSSVRKPAGSAYDEVASWTLSDA